MKKLYLFDSFAIIFRAYFAMQKNPLINSKGQNVSAISGFINTLWEILNKYQPSHLACAFDTYGPTLRHTDYELYKANREETPEDILFATPYIKEILHAFNIPVLEMQGYEADDIIGTIAGQASKQNIETYIVTMDKDLGQVVSDKVFIHRPPYMGNPAEILGVEQICSKWEINDPKQVIDILGLMGDAIDNIPGVAGVGEKTAKSLIKEFGSIDNIYANIDKVKGKLKDKLIEQKDMALLSRQLATVYTDVPVDFHYENYLVKEKNNTRLAEIFAELEFRTLGKRILGEEYSMNEVKVTTASQSTTHQTSLFGETATEVEKVAAGKNINNTEHQYHVVDTPGKIKNLVQLLQKQSVFCFDSETTSLDANNCEIVGLSFCIKPQEAYYIPFPADQKKTRELLESFRALFENEAISKIGQNIKYDALVLKNHGIELCGKLWDTMIAHYLMEPEAKHGMDALSENYLGYTPVSITELIGKKGTTQGNMRDVGLEKIKEYAAEDADITYQLYKNFKKEIDQTHLHKLFYEVESPLISVLTDMEFEGVNIDVGFLREYSKEVTEEIIKLQDQIFSDCGTNFNLDSPKQMGDILFEKLKIPYSGKKTKTGQYSTDEDTLLKIQHEHPVIEHLLNYRELTKLKSTYIDALPVLINPKTNRLHTTFNQTIAATGRLSSINPNLQNIPIRTERGKKIRQAFIPKSSSYSLLSVDYSQIELRIVASISGDENMIEAFRNHLDIHASTASKVFEVPLDKVTSEMRRQAKMVNFGIIYGISSFGLAQRLGIPKSEAAQLITQYFEKYNGIKKYMDDAINKARETGYAETLLGRRRYLRDINAGNFTIRGFAERNAINAPIQGSAADMIKVAMVRIHHQLLEKRMQSKMLLQVHDELLFDVHPTEHDVLKELVMSEMQNALPLQVPVDVTAGFGKNWLEAH